MHRRVTVVGYVCVCVSSSIFSNSNKSAKETYGSPQCCNGVIYNVGFFVKQPLCKDTEFKWQLIIYTHSLDIDLDHAHRSPEGRYGPINNIRLGY